MLTAKPRKPSLFVGFSRLEQQTALSELQSCGATNNLPSVTQQTYLLNTFCGLGTVEVWVINTHQVKSHKADMLAR
jgi:hypothetical protein